jgi:hypothetical protein
LGSVPNGLTVKYIKDPIIFIPWKIQLGLFVYDDIAMFSEAIVGGRSYAVAMQRHAHT